MLSQKQIPSRNRLIFALDVPTVDEAKQIVEELGDAVTFYKIGLELFMGGDYYALINWLTQRDKKIFADLKFFDVPNTVASAIKNLSGRGVEFATVHGNDEILRAACKDRGDLKILAVTVLTSLDDADLKDLGFQVDVKQLVLSRAKRALEIGCDGVISSGLEAIELRGDLGENFLIVVPGIRPVANTDDQKRTVGIEEAFQNGADYIVIGRPIKSAKDRIKAALEVQDRIKAVFS